MVQQVNVETMASPLASDDESAPSLSSSRTDSSCCPLLDFLNDNVLTGILTFLHYEDLNTVAICNRRLRTIRANPSLNQTRSGTIVFEEDGGRDSFTRLVEMIRQRRLANVFQGNRTVLRLRGFSVNFDTNRARQCRCQPSVIALKNVSSLDLQGEEGCGDLHGCALAALRIGPLIPNITRVDISGIGNDVMNCRELRSAFPKLEILTAGGDCQASIFGLADLQILRSFQRLKELYVSGHTIHGLRPFRHFLPPHLERLDIRDTVKASTQGAMEDVDLLDLLKNYPTLRWLRCDASSDVIERFQKLRPDVTIVNS